MSRNVLAARWDGPVLLTALFERGRTRWECLGVERLAAGQTSKFAGQKACLLLGPADRSLRHFVLPPASPANVRRMAQMQTQQRLPDVKGGYLFEILTQKAGTQVAALVVAVPVARAEAGAKRLAEAGLGLNGLAIEPLCYAALAPAKGHVLMKLDHWSVACRDGLPVGWRAEHDTIPIEEYFIDAPREFEADDVLDTKALVGLMAADPDVLPLLAAARATQWPGQPKFQEFLDRESLADASVKEKLVLGSVWAAGLLIALGGAYSMLLAEEHRYEALKEQAAQRAQYSKISQRLVKDLGATTVLGTELRAHTAEKVLTVSRLRGLSDMLPAGVKLTALSFTTDGQMLLDGETTEARLPLLLLDLLRNAPGFSTPVLEFVSDRGSDKITFRITCKPHNVEEPAPKTKGGGSSSKKEEIEL